MKKRNNFFNKAFYKEELQSLSNRLFWRQQKNKNIIIKENKKEEADDPFFSPKQSNYIDINLLKNRERLLSVGNSDNKKYKIENYNSLKFNNAFS